MKSIIIIFAIAIATIASISYGQIHVSSVNIQANYITIENNYNYGYPQIRKKIQDTVNASFSLLLYTSNLLTTDTSITFQYNHTAHNFANDSLLYTDYNQNLSIQLDTLLRIATVVKSTLSIEDHYNHFNNDYWNRNINGIDVGGAPYQVSTNGDTLSIKLDAKALKQFKKYFITQYTEHQTPHTFTLFENENFLDISDSAYVNVTIIGSFPLSVISQDIRKETNIIIHSTQKILKISTTSSNQNQPLSCFDILGRKHNLEFLGTNGSASTYSVRSLRAGVYFVSDGKEMVKFMIGE